MKALAPVRTVAPSSAILSLADAKAHLRVLHDDEDALITALIAAAEAHLDGFSGVLGRALVTQEWERSFDAFPACNSFRLPLGPLGDEVTLSYFDADDVEQTFSDFHAVSDAIGPMIVLQDGATWPSTAARPDAVKVAWRCGYGDVADVPPAIIHAAKLMIGHWYANREAATPDPFAQMPLAVDALLAPLRAVGV
ncbi:head-tail connector protein [Sphingobium sp. CFD-2]|uniref:head-tail connector protein n=1 Tax=Sphingobium sp. CFD-2 TaxID=2878542 RepID=UPI00214C2B5B|nr:head-tail connector protein [Sphingobium sp. CFD-2]